MSPAKERQRSPEKIGKLLSRDPHVDKFLRCSQWVDFLSSGTVAVAYKAYRETLKEDSLERKRISLTMKG